MIRKEKDGVKEVKEIMKRRKEATRSFFYSHLSTHTHTHTEMNTRKPVSTCCLFNCCCQLLPDVKRISFTRPRTVGGAITTED